LKCGEGIRYRCILYGCLHEGLCYCGFREYGKSCVCIYEEAANEEGMRSGWRVADIPGMYDVHVKGGCFRERLIVAAESFQFACMEYASLCFAEEYLGM